MKPFLTCLFLVLIISPGLDAIEPPANLDYTLLREIPIQDGGRYKPLDTFAGESMREITGRWNFEKRDPLSYILSMMTSSQWYDEPLVRIDYIPLKELMGIPVDEEHFSYNQISGNQAFQNMLQRVRGKPSDEYSRLEREVAMVSHKMMLLQSIQTGDALTIVPSTSTDVEAPWLSINHIHGYPQETQQKIHDNFVHLLTAVQADNSSDFSAYSRQLRDTLAQLNPTVYPPEIDIHREISYNHTRPFLRSWIFYMLAFFLFLLSFFFPKNKMLYWGALALCLVGFYYNSWGLILRSLVSHRPPVSNMYESMIFVGWGIVLFAIIFEFVYRARWFATSASCLGVGMLILADIMPFDPNIEPLVPVLRSNYWLIIHVLTITLSYSAFALAMGMAHINLGVYFYFPHKKELLDKLSLFLYRVLQVGVVLLAAGTILGGVWAAESWGRFWGWDPKETWALISLLGYMAVLHARYTKWIGDFGTAVCSVLGFWLVLMTWYGVNFVLATGLHSYGFGSGGGTYVIVYMILELLFLIGVAYKYQLNRDFVESPKAEEITTGS